MGRLPEQAALALAPGLHRGSGKVPLTCEHNAGKFVTVLLFGAFFLAAGARCPGGGGQIMPTTVGMLAGWSFKGR